MPREFPCKLFHTTGNCVNSDECMFSHEPLNDDTQELLNKVRSSDSVPQIPQVISQVPLPSDGDKEVFVVAPPDYGAALL